MMHIIAFVLTLLIQSNTASSSVLSEMRRLRPGYCAENKAWLASDTFKSANGILRSISAQCQSKLTWLKASCKSAGEFLRCAHETEARKELDSITSSMADEILWKDHGKDYDSEMERAYKSLNDMRMVLQMEALPKFQTPRRFKKVWWREVHPVMWLVIIVAACLIFACVAKGIVYCIKKKTTNAEIQGFVYPVTCSFLPR